VRHGRAWSDRESVLSQIIFAGWRVLKRVLSDGERLCRTKGAGSDWRPARRRISLVSRFAGLCLGFGWAVLALLGSPAWGNPVLEWSQTYFGPWQYARNPGCIAVDSSGNVYVSGYAVFTTLPQTLSSWVTLKYNPDGKQEWLRQFGSDTQI
jgi:hypothetical protein